MRPSHDDLRCFVGGKLPRYLIPEKFYFLDELPRTPSGKVDRKALAAMQEKVTAGVRASSVNQTLPAEERHILLEEWNRTESPFDRNLCAHDLVRRRAELSPDAVALCRAGETMTYGELDPRANGLAHRLIELGVAREEPVALFMERSFEAVVGFLGVLKAGGSFVPIDPAVPEERVAFILEDSAAGVVLTQTHLEEKLSGRGVTVLALDAAGHEAMPESNQAPRVEIDPDDRAYIIYTSGSTGRPKGVEIEHHSLANLIHFYRMRLELTPDDRTTMLASLAFDASIADIWPYLATGAEIHIPTTEDFAEPERLMNWIVSEAITVSFMPTALGEFLAVREWPAETRLRYLLTGGDTLRFRPEEPQPFTLMNTYGPTENTVDSIWLVVEPGVDQRFPPIGRPIANVRAYVLDKEMEPVPIGVEGELFLSGEGVARGYLNRPELTAEKFIADPFCTAPDSRLYRTGDLVRYLPEGEIEFLGRVDDQIQIRGFRVELGEIEDALRRHPRVDEATVRPVRKDGAVLSLAAYVVVEGERDGIGEILRKDLGERLPQYMVPSSYTVLDALPRGVSGKVDRNALPDPDRTMLTSGATGRPPADDAERKLVKAWEEVLDVDGVGVDDDFFELGGHSLLVLQLLARIKKDFNRKLSIPIIFQRPTVAQLAEVFGDESAESLAPCIVAIRTEGKEKPIFCAAGVGGGTHWFKGLAGHLGKEQPFYGLEPLGLSAETVSDGSVEAMAAEFVNEIRRMQSDGPYRLGGYSFGGLVALEIAQQLQRQGEEVDLLFFIETYEPGTDATRARWFCRYVCNFLRLSWRRKLLFIKEKIVWIRSLIRDYTITRNTQEEHLELMHAMHAHMQAAIEYRPEPYEGSVVLIRARKPPNSAPLDPEAGWKEVIGGEIHVRPIPGDHYDMFKPPNDAAMSFALRPFLERK